MSNPVVVDPSSSPCRELLASIDSLELEDSRTVFKLLLSQETQSFAKFIIFGGGTGAGKDTLLEPLIHDFSPLLKRKFRYTTRAARCKEFGPESTEYPTLQSVQEFVSSQEGLSVADFLEFLGRKESSGDSVITKVFADILEKLLHHPVDVNVSALKVTDLFTQNDDESFRVYKEFHGADKYFHTLEELQDLQKQSAPGSFTIYERPPGTFYGWDFSQDEVLSHFAEEKNRLWLIIDSMYVYHIRPQGLFMCVIPVSLESLKQLDSHPISECVDYFVETYPDKSRDHIVEVVDRLLDVVFAGIESKFTTAELGYFLDELLCVEGGVDHKDGDEEEDEQTMTVLTEKGKEFLKRYIAVMMIETFKRMNVREVMNFEERAYHGRAQRSVEFLIGYHLKIFRKKAAFPHFFLVENIFEPDDDIRERFFEEQYLVLLKALNRYLVILKFEHHTEGPAAVLKEVREILSVVGVE